MNIFFIAATFILFSGLTEYSFSQTFNKDIKKHLHDYSLKLQFKKPGQKSLAEFPKQKLFLYKKGKITKADLDNMPLHVPDFSKSVKIPQYKPDPAIRYTIKRFKTDKIPKIK